MIIDQTQFYDIADKTFIHCDESQFRYYCKTCSEFMGCQYCDFDPYTNCECGE